MAVTAELARQQMAREEDAFMVPGMGAQPVPPPKYVPANDNVADGKTYPVGHEEPPAGWMDRGMRREKPAPVELELTPPRSVPVDQPEYKSRAWRDGDPNGCADDLVTRAPLDDMSFEEFEREALELGEHVVPPRPAFPERNGDFMQTFTGRKFWPMDARANEVCIRDIAHSLSLQCRYAGHCRRFYSVAEHCVHIASWLVGVAPEAALFGLLHDASEAYLIDVPRPVKPFLSGYRDAEAKVMAAVCQRFGLPLEMPAAVHEADERIIADELVNLVRMQWHARHTDGLGVTLQYWSPEEAEAQFLDMFYALGGDRVGEVG